MDNSPLLYLCPDISNIIGEYLKTYKNNQKIKREFHYLLNRSLIKNFNIRCKEIPYDYYLNKHNDFLYTIPNYVRLGGGWIWTGKRYGESTKHFNKMSRKYGSGKSSACLCMGKCRRSKCKCLKMLYFPRNISKLFDWNYYDIQILLNELPK